MDYETRMHVIADHVLKEEHDIVVFQKVFHDGAKDALVNTLSGTYPHYIYKLDAADLNQDSGLMLFSRYPFAPLPKDTFKADDVTATSSSSPNWIWKDVAFLEFDDCQSYDCWANKGVGLVRVKVPCTNEHVNVVFTHLQASYGDDTIWALMQVDPAAGGYRAASWTILPGRHPARCTPNSSSGTTSSAATTGGASVK